VLIKVVFLEVTHRNSLDIGVEGGGTRQINDSTTGSGATAFGLSGLNSVATNVPLNALGLPVQSFSPVPPGAGLYQVLGSDFQATLRAIAQAGKTEVLSRPSILTRNNQQRRSASVSKCPFISNTRFDTLGNQINTVTYQSVGIILRVTPFITGDGMVEMIVSPETSALADRSQWVPISSGPGGSITAPVIDSRSADTVVVVPDGQTAVIGGLMEKTTKRRPTAKFLLLATFLYWAISSNERSSKPQDRTHHFLTPHIVAEQRNSPACPRRSEATRRWCQRHSRNRNSTASLTMSLAGKSAACEEPEVTPRCPTPLYHAESMTLRTQPVYGLLIACGAWSLSAGR